MAGPYLSKGRNLAAASVGGMGTARGKPAAGGGLDSATDAGMPTFWLRSPTLGSASISIRV